MAERALDAETVAKADADRARDKAKAEADRADAKAADAVASAKLVDEETKRAERLLYVANMNLAQNAWEQAPIGRLLELLAETRPRPGKADLRGFEWYYWNRLSHSYKLDLKGHTGRVNSASFSPDVKRLASASYDGTVKVWDATTGQESLTLKGHTSLVFSVSFSPDGKRLASASDDQTVKVWDATTGQESLTLKGHTGRVTSVSFSPDGARIASASWDYTVKLWDARPLTSEHK